MCGLAGMIGPDIEKKHREMFIDLLGVTYMRGRHSTGVFTATPYGKKDYMKMKKMILSSPEFIRIDLDSRNGSLLSDPWADLIMAHCRSATVGEVNRENCHPFDTPDFVGAHNGTLNDFWSWGAKGTVDEDKTDSLLMFERMNKYGIEHVLKDLTLGSAYAISIYEKKTRKLILARNKHRPLYVAFVKDAGVMYWSSECEMLEFAAARNDVEVDIYHLEKNKMYVVDHNKIKKGNVSPWKVIDVPEKTYTVIRKVEETKTSTSADLLAAINEDDLTNEQCCTCDRALTVKDVNNLTPVNVDGIKYFCCEECSQKAKEELKTMVDKETDKQLKSRLVDAYGAPIH